MSNPGEDHDKVLDELYQSILSENDNTKLQKVFLSSSYPSPISLKLRGIQKILKVEGRMDIDSLNFAIRKLRREETIDGRSKEETIDGNSTNAQSPVRKCYISADFTRYAISNEDGKSDLETCVWNDFMDHHNAFDQDADLSGHSKLEVLCVPVAHYGFWSLYVLNLSDQKLSILDPTMKRKRNHHKSTRLKICKALEEFVKEKFNLFRITSDSFSSWRYEFTNLDQFNNSICRDDADSGFLVFNFMRYWDGHQLVNQGRKIPIESEKLRKDFLKYIVSFNYNEVYDLDHQLIEKLCSGTAEEKAPGSAWRRCKMDSSLLKAVRENNVDGFAKLVNDTMLQKLYRGATCDGDGVLHIAARCGDLDLLRGIFLKLGVELNLDAIERRLQEGSVNDVCSEMNGSKEEQQQKWAELHELLRSRNHKGETCLHEAVRRGDVRFALSLILADEEMNDDKTSALVRRADYEGVSPLYLATTLCRSDIVGILTNKTRKYTASFSGPGGKTAMHAAVLLNKELTEQLLNWKDKDDVKVIQDLGVADKSGNTPLHLVASVGDAAIAKLLLSGTGSGTDGTGTEREPTATCAALKKDSKGWLPIHVAAANGRVDIIKQLLEECPECMESRNASGQSFLHIAVEKKRRNVVQHVCSLQSLAGILNLTDQDGNTALHLAVKTGNQRVFCSLMRNHRVHLSPANREGRTPRDVAKLSLEPGLKLLLSSRVLIYYHLKLSGAHYGACRRDDLKGEIQGKVDKEKLSETISKSAGLMAVCAIFMLNISVTTFFNVAKQHLTPADPNTATVVAAAPALAPVGAGAAEGRSARTRENTFKALIAFDAITFACSVLAAFCCTFAGFSIMDRAARFTFLSIAGFCLQIACMGVVAVFVLAAYLAFTPVDPHIATLACVLPLIAVAPQVLTPSILLIFHAWTLSHRFFQKYILPRLKRFFGTCLPATSHALATGLLVPFLAILFGIGASCCAVIIVICIPLMIAAGVILLLVFLISPQSL
ncbi:unnamed protein product [Urochloa humidicola]